MFLKVVIHKNSFFNIIGVCIDNANIKTADRSTLLKQRIILAFSKTKDVGSQQYDVSSDTIYNPVNGDFIIRPLQ